MLFRSVDESCIVSRYIHNPLLINGLKFDIRLYVVLTSIDPLIIYVYNEGLVRFCTERYDMTLMGNRFSHLTNYSINKRNKRFVVNKEAEADNVGQKWSITALNKHLANNSVDVPQLWARIYDLIIRTIIACEPPIYATYKKTVGHKRNCFELFGFDVLLDEKLKPWLMEVNLSPSLACETPLDQQIKSNLIADMFTLIGIKQLEKKRTRTGFNIRKKSPIDEELKCNSIYKKIAQLNRKTRDILMDVLEEFTRKRNFIRIYPAKGTDYYDNLFEVTRNNHKILHKLLYGGELISMEPDISASNAETLPSIQDTHSSPQDSQTEKAPIQEFIVNKEEAKEERFKILITGDDILIDYVERLTDLLKGIKEPLLKPTWSHSIERFVSHEVWCSRQPHTKLWQQLERRLIEMKERRKNLRKDALKTKEEYQKQIIIKGFTVPQLEEMLRSSTKNSPCVVVNCLIPPSGSGVLSNLLLWIGKCKQSLQSTDQFLMTDEGQQLEDDFESLANVNKGERNNLFPKIQSESEHKVKTRAYLSPIKASYNFIDSDVKKSYKHESIYKERHDQNKIVNPQTFSKLSRSFIRSDSKSTKDPYQGSIIFKKRRAYKPIGQKNSSLITQNEIINDKKIY